MKKLFISCFLAWVVPCVCNGQSIEHVTHTIQELQPRTQPREARAIAQAVMREAQKHGIDWQLLVSILMQESSLQLDPQDCAHKPETCADFGIGQINYRTWGEVLHLDKMRLVTDYSYSIAITVRVLSLYKAQFQTKDPRWFGRYHSATPEYRLAYQKRIAFLYDKIKAVQEELPYERFGRFHFRLEYYGSNFGPSEGVFDRATPAVLCVLCRPDRNVRRDLRGFASIGPAVRPRRSLGRIASLSR